MDPWQPCAVSSSFGGASSHVTNVDDLASALHNEERDHEADQLQDISSSTPDCHQEPNENQESELSFGDNFKPFVKLPDSQEYLESLERKLKTVQKGGKKGHTSESILRSLEQTKESCMIKLLSNSVEKLTIEAEIFEELKVNPVLKKLAPEKQALTAEELVHLLKADQLDIVLSNNNIDELVPTSSLDSSAEEVPQPSTSTTTEPEAVENIKQPESDS